MYSKISIGRFNDNHFSDANSVTVLINNIYVNNRSYVKKHELLCDFDIGYMKLPIYAQQSGMLYKLENFKDNNEVFCEEPLYIIEE